MQEAVLEVLKTALRLVETERTKLSPAIIAGELEKPLKTMIKFIETYVPGDELRSYVLFGRRRTYAVEKAEYGARISELLDRADKHDEEVEALKDRVKELERKVRWLGRNEISPWYEKRAPWNELFASYNDVTADNLSQHMAACNSSERHFERASDHSEGIVGTPTCKVNVDTNWPNCDTPSKES